MYLHDAPWKGTIMGLFLEIENVISYLLKKKKHLFNIRKL